MAEVVGAAPVRQRRQGDHPRPPARRLRLRRRAEGEGQVLHDLLRPPDQLPAEVARRVVAHPVPALGDGQGGARLQGHRRPRAPARHLPRGRQGDGRRDAARGHEEGDALRRRRRSIRRSPRSTPRASPSTRWRRRSDHDARDRVPRLVLPLLGLPSSSCSGPCVSQTVAPDLPSPWKTWTESQPLRPRAVLQGRRDEPGHRPARLLLARAGGQGLPARARSSARPIGFLLGLSRGFHQAFDPIIQFLRPISPLAWLPLGPRGLPEVGAGGGLHDRALRDVAHRHQHRGRRARHQPGLSERRAAC